MVETTHIHPTKGTMRLNGVDLGSLVLVSFAEKAYMGRYSEKHGPLCIEKEHHFSTAKHGVGGSDCVGYVSDMNDKRIVLSQVFDRHINESRREPIIVDYDAIESYQKLK